MKRNWFKYVLLLGVIVSLALAACSGQVPQEAQDAVEEAAEQVEAAATAASDEVNAALTEAAPAVDELATQAAEALAAATQAAEDASTAATEAAAAPTEASMEEATATPEPAPTEEMVEEMMAIMGVTSCEMAADGPFAGIDPSGETIVWWHNHSGSREARLKVLVSEFNANNPCIETDDSGNPVLLPDDTTRVLYAFQLDENGSPARDADGNFILEETSLAGQPSRLYLQAENQGGYDDIRDKVTGSIAAGELPAALLVGYQNDQAFYQLNSTLVNLDEYLQDAHWGIPAEEQAQFYGSFFNQSTFPLFDNARLGFPPNRSMEVLFYNQTWLEELGFSGPPTTPEEFREMACAAAEANGDGTGGYILRDDASAVASWTYAFGGDVLAEDGLSYNYAGDATVQALAFLKQLYDDGCAYFFTEGFPDPQFAARKAIFTQGSSSGIPFYGSGVATVAEEQGREPDVWGVAAIPHTTADPVQNIYGGDIMITANTPEQQLGAWIFVRWFTLPDVQAKWDIASGYFPTRQDTVGYLTDYLTNNPQWAQAVSMLPYAYYEPQLISYTAARDGAQAAFNEIMQLPAGWTNDDITAILTTLTDTANATEEELMSEAGG